MTAAAARDEALSSTPWSAYQSDANANSLYFIGVCTAGLSTGVELAGDGEDIPAPHTWYIAVKRLQGVNISHLNGLRTDME